MKNIFTTCFFSLMIINTFGQVSIGNENTPNSEVILDLSNSDGKGLLLPKKNSSVTEPLGNIFYNSSKNMIGVVDSISGGVNVVNYLSPWRHTDANSDVTYSSNAGKVIITNTDAANDGRVVLEVQDGSINVKNGSNIEYSTDINDATSGLNGPIPSGGIIMWSGYSGAIPTGWKICDGTVGTPNLTGRFIVGYNGTYGKDGATGGANNVTLTSSQVPNHTHTGYASPSGAHYHNMGTRGFKTGSSGTGVDGSGDDDNLQYTRYAGDHGHILNINPTTGGGNSHENRPPYWALAFIMKK